ncbi:GNAT family N-acetyltransferase [Pukyongiella litopenaei]|uniref:GNAT family N-acetyltransferase n=1 Tax=Pukyongiella litopenaei TaxID=2605946 RepID=A0A2S0MM33_9RHOB|nr:GNAT family N-acetyltransferase [Pukyongiella litopenaei]AVO36948.1 GNAT family N-acetyltransferase [Pukyongiella litopenaei]
MDCSSLLERTEIRRLWPADRQDIVDHFLLLDAESRRLRFGVPQKDICVQRYAEHLLGMDSVVFGAYVDGRLRGLAELCGFLSQWPRIAEAALSIQRDWQHAGIGDALFTRLIAAAQNRSVRTLHMTCLRENECMQHLARKHEAVLEFIPGEVQATLGPPRPTLSSMTRELLGLGETRRPGPAHLPMPA